MQLNVFKKISNNLKMKQHNRYLKNETKYPNHKKVCKSCQRNLSR